MATALALPAVEPPAPPAEAEFETFDHHGGFLFINLFVNLFPRTDG